MKGLVNNGNYGRKTGGDRGFATRNHKVTSRNIRRLIKKFPNDCEIQSVLNAELEKLKNKGDQ